MRAGINLLLWTGHVTEEHRPVLETIAHTGYDLVEIPVMTGEVAHYAELGRWLDELGLSRTTSMAFTDSSADPVSEDPVARARARDQLSWQIDCARAMGATKVIGPMYQVLGRFSGTGPTTAELDRVADLLLSVAPRAAEAGVNLVLEPLNRFECHLCNTLAAGVRIARRVDHSAVSVMVDTFHANLEEKDTPAAIRAAGDAIGHVHISESDRGTPGTGQVDFPAVSELAAATCIWRDTFESPEALARDALPLLRSAEL